MTTTTSLSRSAPHTRTVQGKSSSRRLQRIRRPNANKFKTAAATKQQRRGSANSHLFHAPLQEGDDDTSQFQFSIDPSQYCYQQQCISSNELTVDDESLYYDYSQRKLSPPLPTEEEDLQQSRARRMMVAGTDNSIPTLLKIGESKRLTKDNVSAMTLPVVNMEDMIEECDDSSLTFRPDEGIPKLVTPRDSQFSLRNGTAKGISNLSMDDTSATEEEDSLQGSSRRFRWSAPATIPEDTILSPTANEQHIQKQTQQKKALLGRLWKTLFVSSSQQTKPTNRSNPLRRSTPTPKSTTTTSTTSKPGRWGFRDEAAVTVQQCRQRQRQRQQRAQSVPASRPPTVVLRVPKSEVPSPGATLHLSQTGVPVWHNESGRVLPFTSSEC